MEAFDKCVVIEALAGAGKTYKLAHRYLQLVAMGADPRSILATTFSRKAAGEIRDRIIEAVALAVVDEEKRKELFGGIPNMEQTKEACVALLRTIVSNLHRLEIGTIDSFFVRTARVFGEEIGFPPQWEILDELREKSVLRDAVSDMLNSNDIKTISDTIRLAHASTVVPVADTMKKIMKYAYDVLRYTGAAAWEHGEPLSLLSPPALEAAIETLASQETEITRHKNSIQSDVARAKSGDWRKFLMTGLPAGLVNESLKYYGKEIDPALVRSLQPVVDHASASMLNALLAKNAGIVSLMTAFNGAWSAVKHEKGLYRFDDITYYLGACSVLDDLKELAFRLDATVEHLLIDEFQDTSLPQWDILQPLVDEIRQSSADRSLFFVGDPKQSLYGFRGGEPQLLRELPAYLELEGPSRLPTSWRCSSTVLDIVNTVFDGAKRSQLLLEHSEEGVKEWMRSFVPHVSAVPSRLGFVEIHTTDADETRQPTLEYTVEKVSEVVCNIHNNCPNASIGILVRKNTSQQIQRIVHALRSHKTHPVMASEHGGNPLTDSPPVTLVLSALLLSDHPGDTSSLFHVSTSPLGESLGLKPSSDRKDAVKASEELRRNCMKYGYAQVVHALAEPLFATATERDQLRLWQLIELSESYCQDETLRPTDFVEFVKKKSVADPATSKVQVMTVHASKGLGFDAVVVCDLDQPLWGNPDLLMLHDDTCVPAIKVSVRECKEFNSFIPDQEEMWNECTSNQVQEALSQLYVAMTRAKHALYLVIPPRPAKPSEDNPAPSKAKCVDRLLRQAVGLDEFLPPDTVVWSSTLNEEAWYTDIKHEENTSSDKGIDAITFSSCGSGMRAVATASPSSLEGGGKVHVSSRFSGDTHVAFDRGTVVHSWFENMLWLEDGIPTIETLVSSAPRAAAGRLTQEKVKGAATRFIEAMKLECVEQLLTKPDEPVQVYREQEFVLRVEKDTSFGGVPMNECTDIRGSIDRLVVHLDDGGIPVSAEVIDWKTDRFDSGELDEKVAHYAPQLASYRLAAAQLLGIDVENVTAFLAFVMEGHVIDVTESAIVLIPVAASN